MRKIPAHIIDAIVRESLAQIDLQIDEKMGLVNILRASMKKKELGAPDLQELKKLGTAIDELDQKWKSLIEANQG